MTSKQLREEILSLTYDIQFEYKGINCLIMPFSHKKFMLCYGDDDKQYTDIDDVMSDPFFDGKSLNEISQEVKYIQKKNIRG